jgi:hypothetical protein
MREFFRCSNNDKNCSIAEKFLLSNKNGNIFILKLCKYCSGRKYSGFYNFVEISEEQYRRYYQYGDILK